MYRISRLLLYCHICTFCLGVQSIGKAQSLDSVVIENFFSLEQRRCDSLLQAMESKIEQSRLRILEIAQIKGLDAGLICGTDSAFCKAGMSDQFKEKPHRSRIDMAQDPRLVELEALFLVLYESDIFRKALLLYRKDIAALRENLLREKRFSDLALEELNTRLTTPIDLLRTQVEAVDFPDLQPVSFDYPASPKPDYQKMLGDPSIQQQLRSTSPEVHPMNMISAYPAKGQYNLYIHEPGLQLGWLRLHQSPEVVLEARYNSSGKRLLAQWTDAKGKQAQTHVYCHPDVSLTSALFFDLPVDFLKPNTVYRLELGAVAEDPLADDRPSAIISGMDFLTKDRTVSRLPSAPAVFTDTLYTAFFRTSKYGSFREKVEKSEISYDPASGRYSVKTDEPFDKEECYNGAGKPFVAMDNPDALLPDRIYSSDMYYYFNVPRMQDLDTLHCPPYLDSEINHTYNTAAVIYPDLAVTVTFPEPPQPGVDTVWQNVPLPAAPLQSFLLDTTGLNDYTVTEADFRKKRRSHPAGSYRFFFKNPIPVETQKALVFSQEKIKARMLTRASYLFLEYRCRARRGLEDGSLDYNFFLEREKQHLPKSLREVLDWQITLPGNAGRKIYLYYFIPNTDQYSSLVVKLLNP